MDAIRRSASRYGITRLCHFTPSRNLGHIATDPRGVLATKYLSRDERAVFNPTDAERFDGYPDHICCSIQIPNAWYFRKARDKERLFDDWAVLLIKPDLLWQVGTKFCPRNAAANRGRDVREGAEAFEAMFAPKVLGAKGRTYERDTSYPLWLPTDEQAEILVPDRIAQGDILGVAVRDEAQARRELARLRLLHQPALRFIIAADFFEPAQLSRQVHSGTLPAEREYIAGAADVRDRT